MTTLLTYGFLYLSVISLWIPQFKKIPIWLASLTIAVIFGLISHRLNFLGLIFIFSLMLCAYLLRHKSLILIIRILAATILVVLSAGLMAHYLPGFHNLKVLNHVQISTDGIPFTLYLNFDKTVVGIIILGLLHPLITTKVEWIKMLKATVPKICIVIAALILLSLILKFVRFDPKLPHSLLLWSTINLLSVCLAEEAFFRGFLQKYLCIIFQCFTYGNLMAIVIVGIIFGLAHYQGSIKYIFLAAIAGIGYGWIYHRTKRVEAAILTHFSLNLIHFLLFTYPALANAF